MSAAELTAEYILSAVQQRGARTWRQGARHPQLPCADTAPSLRVFAEHRIRGVSELAVRGLWLLNEGFAAELTSSVPAPERVLALQARGARLVSLLPSEAQTDVDGLDFALHDLCHLSKFADRHYEEQVGFFFSLERAFRHPVWHEVEAELDAPWLRDRAQVSSDMNGSSIFLFAVLKMKLKMAARRRLAAKHAATPPVHGPLSLPEYRVFEELQAALLDALELPQNVGNAAVTTSARRDSPEAAALLASYFHERGKRLLSNQNPRPKLSPAKGWTSSWGAARSGALAK